MDKNTLKNDNKEDLLTYMSTVSGYQYQFKNSSSKVVKDYTQTLNFWERLYSFIADIQTNCAMGEEEKEMILHYCKLKIKKL